MWKIGKDMCNSLRMRSMYFYLIIKMDNYYCVFVLCQPRSAGIVFSTVPSFHSSWVPWTTRDIWERFGRSEAPTICHIYIYLMTHLVGRATGRSQPPVLRIKNSNHAIIALKAYKLFFKNSIIKRTMLLIKLNNPNN